ncbi:MAG: PQQ-dependent sugar dehydrogenase [Pseudomonadota bacterium]|nr:PQQ-dependent sugar dehydrogenase [Pseudomonadota bacterium]MEC8347824.1 PQQ-dependent sugar dehydrogenase [Pseudomonadota bacterium]
MVNTAMSAKALRNILVLTLLFSASFSAQATQNLPFKIETVTAFDEPWAMAFLPNGHMLVTEKKGRLLVVDDEGEKRAVSGLPDVGYGGQGGMGDIALHPDFATNGMVYLSYVESAPDGTRGAAVGRGRIDLAGSRPSIAGFEVLWRQYPKMVGYGHYGHRLVFDDEGYLWITSGDRQKFTPAQDMQSNLGKVLRLNDDGSVPSDNPFVDHFADSPLVDRIGVYGEVWSLGHRNPLGIAQDSQGSLWVIEMGPRHGDELNLIRKGGNYGYPEVSDGDHYDRRPIPDHITRPDFEAPKISWVPAISPSHLSFVEGTQFEAWRGNALAAGLGAKVIVRIEIDGATAREVERYDMKTRIRSVVEGPQGALWVLEDERGSSKGRLLKLTPK